MFNLGLISDRFRKSISYRRILEQLVKRPFIGILITGMLTVAFGFHLPDLAFRTSIYDLVVEDLPDTTRYQVFKSIFGSEEIIRVVIKSEGVFEPTTFLKIAQLSEAASKIEGVRRVISLAEIRKVVDPSGKQDLALFESMVSAVALFRKNLISEDRRTTVLTLLLKNEADKAGTIESVRQMISTAPKSLSLYQIGMPLVAEALVLFTEKDFLRLPPITLSIISIILLIMFRNFASIAIPLGCVVLTLVWTFGLMAWLNTPLSMLTMIIPVFLIAVGTAYCLHVVFEYMACAKKSAGSKATVIESFQSVSFPSFLAVSTTIVGLGSLFVNRIVSIHEFALFSCAGMLSLLFILLIFLPSTLALLPLPKTEKPFMRFNRLVNHVLDAIVRLSIKHQRATLSVIAVVAVICCVGLTFLRVETNPVDQFRRDAPIHQHFHDIYKDLSGSFPVNVVMNGRMEDYFEKPDNLRRLSALQKFLETLPGVDKTVSFADYMMLVNYAINHYDPKYYALPEEGFEVRMVINNYKNILGEEMLSRFMAPDFSKTNILLLTHLSNSVDFLKLKETILDHVRTHLPEDIGWETTGFGMVIAASSHLLTLGQLKSFSLTALFIFGLMTILFLSTKVGLIATLPNVFPILVVFGLMGWLGISLSMVTSLVASIAIGLAVDDTVHYLVRYNREFKKDLNKDRAMRDTIRNIGRPIILTTLVISLGFSILMFSHFKPTAIFGILMVITMLAALVGDLILLPALMLHVELVTAWDLLKRMPALEGMSPNAAHELKQPLNAIKMGSEYLDMMLQRGGTVARDALVHVTAEIGLQVDRATVIINRLSRLSQNPKEDPEPVNVNHAVTDALEILANQLTLESIAVRIELAENLPTVDAHDHRLGQVMLNLLTNAMEAIKVKQAADNGREGDMVSIRSGVNGYQVVITVEDTGIGIPEHRLDRVAEPFYSTKDASTGKGLGLSICDQIIRGYGGTIRIQSKENVGTTVDVILPSSGLAQK